MHKYHFPRDDGGEGGCEKEIIFVHSTQPAIAFLVGEKKEKKYLICSPKFTYSAFNFAAVNI